MQNPLQSCLGVLPDDPLHVEIRGLLMCRSDVSIVPDPRAPETSGVLFAPAHGLFVGYGSPSVELLPDLRALADRSGMKGQEAELHLSEAAAVSWLAHDSVRALGQNRIQALADTEQRFGPGTVDRILELAGHDAEAITDPSDARLATLPASLQLEYANLCPWPAVVAVMAQGRIASIAYAFVETESHFDVSIDTVHPFRREGYGVACAAALIRHQLRRGKHPVWIASEKNEASLALSAKLGFQDVGRMQSALL